MKMKIAVVPGDGIGPEVTAQAVRALQVVGDVCGHTFECREYAIGGAGYLKAGNPLPDETLKACLEADAVLLGAVGGPQFEKLEPHLRPEAGLLRIRKELGCFANLRPAIAYPTLADCSPLKIEVIRGADILVVRELLGGLYFAEPRGVEQNSAYNTMRYSEAEIERIAHVAFKAAMKRRKKVTSVDKANVLETSRLWRQVVTRVAQEYPEITLEHALVDSFAMQMITTPTRFDVVLTENLFGDILSDESAVIAGSLGLLASASIGGKVDLYEPIHGSAPDIAGKGIANPIGAIASVAMFLRYTAELPQEATAIEDAIRKTLEAGLRTKDLVRGGGRAVSTEEMGNRILDTLGDLLHSRMAYHAV
ncbi:MAG TPA: 3-isopropylmalate dehydrogenase [candidate division Zixibacteria bacterium]|nr:3-isopropylmalate dehydrogenase [candidate division Zixibacteria bacterium]